MAKSENIKYPGFDFALALQPTGKQPLDSRTIVTSLPEYPSDFEQSAAYEGMLVTLLGANGNHKIYVLENTLEEILSNDKLRWREAGGGSTVVSSYDDLIEFASKDNIGKTVYLDTEVNDGSETTYTPGLYVVIGEGSVNKLAATATGGQDLASLSAEISNIKTTISNLDASYDPVGGQYISGISQTDGIISITRADLPTLSDLDGITPEEVDTKISDVIGNLNCDLSAPVNEFIVGIKQENGKITSITSTELPTFVTPSELEDALNDLDSEIKLNSNEYITGITQENGVITSYTFGTLPEIESATVEGTSQGLVYSYSDGQLTESQLKLSVSTDNGKVSNVEFNDFGNLVTKEYVDHMHTVLLGDNNLKDTIDTITEISYWLDNNPNDAVELTLSLAELTERVNNNETNIEAEISEINNKFSEYATIIYVDEEIEKVYAYINSRLSWDVI